MSKPTIRDILLKSAREAGDGYLQVRGCDLEAAITGNDVKPTTKGKPRTTSEQKPATTAKGRS